MQEPFSFMLPPSNWHPPESFPNLEGAIAVDLETNDPMIKTHGPGWPYPESMRGHIAGVAVADSAGFQGYYPIGHKYGGNLPAPTVLGWLKEQVQKDRPVVFANATYDLGWLLAYGIKIPEQNIHDVQIQAPLIDENRMWFSLDSLGKDYLKERKDESLLKQAANAYGLKDFKGQMWMLPSPYVGPYAEQDAALTLKLFNHFNTIMEGEGLGKIYDMERAIVPCLLAMRQNGVRVDLDYAEQLLRRYKREEKEALDRIKYLTGEKVDSWEGNAIARILESQHNIVVPRTDKNNYSITADFLQDCATKGVEFASHVIKARKLQNAYSTFIEGFVFGHHINGRIHGTFNALRSDEGGTVSGRFSSSGPNLQNIPARDPILGPEIRSMFLPEEGELWAAEDYSSQEPRLTVHFAVMSGCEGAQEAADKYNNDPDTDYHQMVADMCGIPRKQAKNINLGLAYGMGNLKLCKELGLPTEWVPDERKPDNTIEVPGEEAKALFDLYHTRVPFIGSLQKRTQRVANQRGYIKTILGRHCHFPLKEDSRGFKSRWYTHKALNRLIQGSAADQMKAAMLEIYRLGKIPLVTVHDEIGLSVKDKAEAIKWMEVIRDCVKLVVPNKVDVEVGRNWGDSMIQGKIDS